MRWNPKTPGEHQYASDVDWDDNIAWFMKHFYKNLGIKKMTLTKIITCSWIIEYCNRNFTSFI